ncbi:MAG: hypothetical protein U0793_11225 [Gemmataceae bacterium]
MEAFMQILLIVALIHGVSVAIAWMAASYLKKSFTSTWAAWAGKVGSLFLVVLLVGAGIRDLNRGLSDGVGAAFALAFIVAAFWPAKWLVQKWIAGAPDRANAREQAAEARRIANEEKARADERERQSSLSTLVAWYEKRKREIEQSVPEGRDRDMLLSQLYNRYDEILKERLQEIQP